MIYAGMSPEFVMVMLEPQILGAKIRCCCGVLCYAADPEGDDSGSTVEQLDALALNSPERFCKLPGSFVVASKVLGMTLVHRCECGRARTTEELIWEQRDSLATYLYLRSEREAREAKANACKMDVACESVRALGRSEHP